MPVINEYLATLAPEVRAEFERMFRIVRASVPDPSEGMSYAMPAVLYKGWPVISLIVNKKFLSLIPFSGKVVAQLEKELAGFECTSGSIHFSLDQPIPDQLLRQILRLRMAEIDLRGPKK